MTPYTFVKRTWIPAAAEEVFAWHEAPGAFHRLTPPWEKVRVVRQTGGIRDGDEVSLLVGPLMSCLRWDLIHCDYQPGYSFTDCQVRGPFKVWRHVHRMIPDGPEACILEDEITYQPPGGRVGALLAHPFMKRKLARLFAFRHEVTLAAFQSSQQE